MYSIALGARYFKWKMLSLLGPTALLFLQLLIAFITRSAVNVRAISNGFLLVSLVTIRVSLEEVCLPSFEVLNCWLNLVASCLDDENELPLKVITSFSALAFCSAINSFNSFPPLGQVCLFGPWFQQSLSIFFVCAHRYGSRCLYSILSIKPLSSIFLRKTLLCR